MKILLNKHHLTFLTKKRITSAFSGLAKLWPANMGFSLTSPAFSLCLIKWADRMFYCQLLKNKYLKGTDLSLCHWTFTHSNVASVKSTLQFSQSFCCISQNRFEIFKTVLVQSSNHHHLCTFKKQLFIHLSRL